MSTPFSFSHYLAAHARLADALDAEAFQGGIEVVRTAFERGSQVITCGNGGSAHTASHYITDWNKAITLATGKPFRGISLCDNSGIVTALANDLAYEEKLGEYRRLADALTISSVFLDSSAGR